MRALLSEQLEVTLSGHASGAQIILDDEHRHGAVFGDDHWPDHTGLGENHVIAFSANANEAIGLENLDHFVDWSRSEPYKVERGEGECAV